jgi:hypothetical protein
MIEDYYWDRYGPYPVACQRWRVQSKTKGKVTMVNLADADSKFEVGWEDFEDPFLRIVKK